MTFWIEKSSSELNGSKCQKVVRWGIMPAIFSSLQKYLNRLELDRLKQRTGHKLKFLKTTWLSGLCDSRL